MKTGCNNCRYCKCYRGDYCTPDDYECVSQSEEITEEAFRRAWENGEEWDISDEPICPAYEEAEPEPDYDGPEWDKYAYEREEQ